MLCFFTSTEMPNKITNSAKKHQQNNTEFKLAPHIAHIKGNRLMWPTVLQHVSSINSIKHFSLVLLNSNNCGAITLLSCEFQQICHLKVVTLHLPQKGPSIPHGSYTTHMFIYSYSLLNE